MNDLADFHFWLWITLWIVALLVIVATVIGGVRLLFDTHPRGKATVRYAGLGREVRVEHGIDPRFWVGIGLIAVSLGGLASAFSVVRSINISSRATTASTPARPSAPRTPPAPTMTTGRR